jgi:rare lipoprotein A (peptidoglycan hydrolase)
MHDSRFRRVAADDNPERPTGLLAQPDRVALWAVVLAIVAMIAGAASAHGESSGGLGSTSAEPSGGASPTPPRNAGRLDWMTQKATWYGPGFFGNETACGEKLRRTTLGVAHRSLPCGARVVIGYNGSYLRTTVIDRGPYAHGAKWDLTQAAARELGFEVTDRIRVARLPRPKRR